jgi:hypothetical protein
MTPSSTWPPSTAIPASAWSTSGTPTWWRDPFIPEAAVIDDLFEFERLYQDLPEAAWRQYETVLQNHPNQLPLKEIEITYENCA